LSRCKWMMNDAIREMELPSGEFTSITLTNARSENVIKLITYRVWVVLYGITCVLSSEIVIKSLSHVRVCAPLCMYFPSNTCNWAIRPERKAHINFGYLRMSSLSIIVWTNYIIVALLVASSVCMSIHDPKTTQFGNLMFLTFRTLDAAGVATTLINRAYVAISENV